MKVLFQNRPKLSWQGGDYVQMEATAKALIAKGIEVEISDQLIYVPALKYRHFDVIHGWNFSMPWTPYHLGLAFRHNKPTVCSMIYHDLDNFVSWKSQQEMLDGLSKAIFLNQGEVDRLKNKLTIGGDKIAIIENGLEADWFKKAKIVPQRPYVLTVGRIEAHKGQLAVAKACNELGIKYIMVGQVVQEGYKALCELEGAIYGGMKDKKELRELYANATCVVLNSKAEVQPLTIMEAGAQGCNVIVSNGCLWKDIPGALWVETDNIEQIKKSISICIDIEPNKELKQKMKSLTWDKVADRLIGVYEEVISKPAFDWKYDGISNNPKP